MALKLLRGQVEVKRSVSEKELAKAECANRLPGTLPMWLLCRFPRQTPRTDRVSVPVQLGICLAVLQVHVQVNMSSTSGSWADVGVVVAVRSRRASLYLVTIVPSCHQTLLMAIWDDHAHSLHLTS